MIELDLQFKLIIFSFIFGFLFSIILDFFNSITKKIPTLADIILSFFLICFMSIFYFIGIKKIGNAIFHIYSIISIVVGFLCYDGIIKLIANNKK